jgi:hypothetical protein
MGRPKHRHAVHFGLQVDSPVAPNVDGGYEEALCSACAAEDFLDWLIPGKQADLIDGEINTHSPVSIRHADLLNFVDFLLRSYV